MPSSPGPSDYRRTPQRFFYRGISLQPQDALADGKHAFALNIRSHEEGTIEPRYGLSLLTTDGAPIVDAPIHSIARLNDATPFATVPAQRLLGVAGDLYAVPPSSAVVTLADTGYSGAPLSIVAAPPYASPRSFAYIADVDRQRKLNTDLDSYAIGITQPSDPPTAELAPIEVTFLETVGTGLQWASYASADLAPPAPLPVVSRIATVITNLVYDVGTTGMCSLAVAAADNITPGCTVEIGPAVETVIVQEVLPPIAPTTIAAILYDVGNTGLCTIQPTGSFSAGQIEVPRPEQIAQRYTVNGRSSLYTRPDLLRSQRNTFATRVIDRLRAERAARAGAVDALDPLTDDAAPPPVTITRTVDFPVNALVLIDGVEVVRILSIAVGPDGVMSFRCSTLGTFAAGATLSGLGTLRVSSLTTFAVGMTVDAAAVETTFTPATTAELLMGFQTAITGGPRNWNLVGARATQPEDIIRLGMRMNLLGYVKTARLVLSLTTDPTNNLKEYYFYEWRAADLISAIQATAESVTGLVSDAQRAAVEQGQFDQMYRDQYGQQQQPGVALPAGPLAIPRSADHALDRPGGTFATRAIDRLRARRAAELAKLAPVSTGGNISRQLALGNNAWMTLECRIGDLTRVGTDVTLTLDDILGAIFYLQIEGTTDPLVIDLSDCYVTGGYGPDVSSTLPPYVYCYNYRSTITGDRSNPSPPMRAGMLPHRGRVELAAPLSADLQVDQVDWWRFGGALSRWCYVGASPHDAAASPALSTFADDMADDRIDGGPSPSVTHYQPWPTIDQPRFGTCTVAGTAVAWDSGDLFNPAWAPSTIILINGIATTLYQSPTSTTRLSVVDNVGSGTAVPFFIPLPTLLSQTLPTLFGGAIAGAWFHFAVGDPADPGAVHWTHANNPDAASDVDQITVTSASEPLINGCLDGETPYVFSSDRPFVLAPAPGGISLFVARELANRPGLWSRWALAVDPNGTGTYYLAKDGIYRLQDGVCITRPDLQPLFPLEGTVPEAIRNLNPVDMTAVDALKLTFVGTYLYFDYLDTTGAYRTLVYEPVHARWTPDAYTPGITARYDETGQNVLTHLVGGADGNLYAYTSEKITDDLTDINWALWTPWANGDDPRTFKQFGDAILDFNPGGSENGVQVTPVVDNGNVALDPRILGAGDTLRDTYIVEVGADSLSGYGVISRNCGLLIEGAVQACDIQRPLLYLWEPSFIPKGTSVARRSTDWEDLGYKGAKFIQGVVIRANTFNQQKLVEVQFDGPNAAPSVAMTVSLLHDGEQAIAYPITDDGWQPFLAELVRLQGADDVEWTLLDWRWVWEPAPEAATQWETQDTTFDLPGFVSVADGVMAYAADATVELVVQHDQTPIAYTLPPTTGGEYQRIYLRFGPYKGKSVKFQWFSDLPFRLYKRDCSVRIQGWGIPGGYQTVNPFGGTHRVDGAGI